MPEAFRGCSRALIFAAHADDESLGAGGTLIRMTDEGVKLTVAVATDSASAQYTDKSDAIERRRREFNAAMKHIRAAGSDWLQAPDMRLESADALALNAWCARLVDAERPDVVFTPWSGDINADHRALTRAVHVACRPRPGSPVQWLLEYETPSSSEWGTLASGTTFSPQVYVDITGTIDGKLRAIAAYESELRQAPHPRSLRSVRALAEYRGSVVGFGAAEGFVVRYARHGA